MTAKEHLRIYICGPHSTGKTTLLHDLQPYLDGVKVIEEVARGIIRDHGWQREEYLPDVHPDVFIQLNREILEKQIEVDLQCSDQDCISDRGIDPIVYVSCYIGKEARDTMYNVKCVDQWINRMRKSIVFLISPHQECIQDDNVRLASNLDELQKFHHLFEEELQLNDVPFHRVDILDRAKRVQQVLEVIDSHRDNIKRINGVVGDGVRF